MTACVLDHLKKTVGTFIKENDDRIQKDYSMPRVFLSLDNDVAKRVFRDDSQPTPDRRYFTHYQHITFPAAKTSTLTMLPCTADMDENFNPNRVVDEYSSIAAIAGGGKPGAHGNQGGAVADVDTSLIAVLGGLGDGDVAVIGDLVAIRAGPVTYHPIKAIKVTVLCMFCPLSWKQSVLKLFKTVG